MPNSNRSRSKLRAYCARYSVHEHKRRGFEEIPLYESSIGWDRRSVQSNLPVALTRMDNDLMTLAVVVAHVDRVFRRSKADWSRQIKLDVPVFELDRWSAPGIKAALEDCLGILTADAWELSFHARDGKSDDSGGALRLTWQSHRCVVPYSGGLDSFAAIQCLSKNASPPLAVTTGHSSHSYADIKRLPSVLTDWAGARIVLKTGKHPDSTYRSRGLVFLTLAAVVAHNIGAETIVVPETGIGSIGSALTPLGVEYPAHGTHPLFTSRFHSVLTQLWDNGAPQIEHPFLWMTKSQLVEEAIRYGGQSVLNEINKTRSCTYVLRRGGAKHQRQCGICPNCLLRRSSLVNAGLEKIAANEDYYWFDLAQAEFPNSMRSGIEPRPRDWQVARSGVLVMEALARGSIDLQLSVEIGRIGAATGMSREDVEVNLSELLQRHRSEWETFLDSQTAPGSWVRELCEVA